jgi:GT2 family glycosyltransferase
MTKVQVIMPCVNLWAKYTKPALDSIETAMVRAKDHGIDCRILLIDNASTDETKVEAGKLVSTIFSHHRNETRWGFQQSVNYGVKDAFERGFDIAFVVNNDIILHPEAIWRLADRFAKGGVGMVTCMDVAGEMKEKGMVAYDVDKLLAQDKEQIDEAEHPCFSAFALDADCWHEIGEMDELFFPAYHEDNDYHYRMKLDALPAIVLPTSMFFHFGSRTTIEGGENGKQVVTNLQFENTRSNYVKKWGGRPGEEKYEHPYNDSSKSIRSTLQNPNA